MVLYGVFFFLSSIFSFGGDWKKSELRFISKSAMGSSEVIFQAEYRHPISDFLARDAPGMFGLMASGVYVVC